MAGAAKGQTTTLAESVVEGPTLPALANAQRKARDLRVEIVGLDFAILGLCPCTKPIRQMSFHPLPLRVPIRTY
jgi:hypothetical protein